MARNLISVLSFAFALIISLGSEAHGYPTPVDFDGKILRWNMHKEDPPLYYEIVTDSDDVRDEFSTAINDAAVLWNNVQNSFIRMEPALEGQNPQISIHLQTTISGGDYSAGYSTFDAYDSSGPTHCEIYIAVDDTTAYVPFAKTALHEIGHCLGLGHSLIPEAIMSYELDKNRFSLDIDDRAAVSRLYPADGSKPKLPPGCAIKNSAAHGGTFGNPTSVTSATGSTGLAGLIELLILLLLPLVPAARVFYVARVAHVICLVGVEPLRPTRRKRSHVPGTHP